MPSNRTGAQKRRKKRNKKDEATTPQGGLRLVKGHEPTLKAPAIQHELEMLAKDGIELELQEVEQTETSNGNKNHGSDALPNNDTATKRMENNMNQTTTTAPNTTQSEPVTNENWGPRAVTELHQIGCELKDQNSPAAWAKQAAVTTGAVVVGGLAVQGVVYLVHRWFGAPAVKRT